MLDDVSVKHQPEETKPRPSFRSNRTSRPLLPDLTETADGLLLSQERYRNLPPVHRLHYLRNWHELLSKFFYEESDTEDDSDI